MSIEIKVKVEKISIFNPFVGAYCEVSIEDAEKFIESANEVEMKIKELKGENKKSEKLDNNEK